jgi:hypothetical protein
MKPTKTQIENAAEAINTLDQRLSRMAGTILDDVVFVSDQRDQFSDLVTVFRHWRDLHERRRNVARRGGEATGKNLTPAERSERARNAAKARHEKALASKPVIE